MPNFFAQFTDAHAHLPDVPALDAEIHVPASAKILLNSARPTDFPRVAKLAGTFPENIIPAFGVHPWFAEEWTLEAKNALRRNLAETPDATLGEIGLDKCRGNAQAQEKAFWEQLEIAAEFGVPATVHCVHAFGKTEEILRKFSGKIPAFLLHAYSGSAEQAKAFARLGCAFSAPRKPLSPECAVVPESDAPLPVGAGTRAEKFLLSPTKDAP